MSRSAWKGSVMCAFAALAACLGSAVVLPASQAAASETFATMNNPSGIYWRSAPSWTTPERNTATRLYPGSDVTLICHKTGTTVPTSTDHMWDQARWASGPGGGSGWINEHFIDDGMPVDQAPPGVPACATGGAGESGTTEVSIHGVVTCAHAAPVVGVWVASSGGGSRFATWKKFSPPSDETTYWAAIRTALPATVQLHVGCGRTPHRWGTTNYSARFALGGNEVLNVACNDASSCAQLSAGNAIVDAATAWINKVPYCFGGGTTTGPTHGDGNVTGATDCGAGDVGFDCTGLALYAVYQATGQVVAHSSSIVYDGTRVSLSNLEPGDVLVFGTGDTHVGIYVGRNRENQQEMVDANIAIAGRPDGVHEETVAWEEGGPGGLPLELALQF